MDEYPAHWQNTLMGWDFWKDAAVYEEELSKKPEEEEEEEVKLDVHKRFPFNLACKEGADEITKKRRWLSLGDITRTTSLRFRPSLSAASTRIRDFGRRACSPSPAKPVSNSPRLLVHSPKIHDLKNACLDTVEVTSPLSQVQESPTVDIATPENPLAAFHGGESWKLLMKSKKSLGLDLFWPVQEDQEEPECLSLNELMPLCHFRCLRSLKLTGMMQSYQTYIWQVAWLNMNLDELELGMVLEPEILSDTHLAKWRLIQDGWKINGENCQQPVYYGHCGDGNLHPDIGCGEYLDKHCIEKAKIRAMAMGRTSKRLTIKALTLTGFVVDGDPFLHWFDPDKLRSIHFKGYCVDAGFWLPRGMQKVAVRYSKQIDLEAVPVGITELDRKDLKVIRLKGGKKVKEMAISERDGVGE